MVAIVRALLDAARFAKQRFDNVSDVHHFFVTIYLQLLCCDRNIKRSLGAHAII